MAYSADAYGPWKQQYDKSRATVTRTSYEASRASGAGGCKRRQAGRQTAHESGRSGLLDGAHTPAC